MRALSWKHLSLVPKDIGTSARFLTHVENIKVGSSDHSHLEV